MKESHKFPGIPVTLQHLFDVKKEIIPEVKKAGKSRSTERRKLIGSIFSENFTFEDLKDRTAHTSEAFKISRLINRLIGSYRAKKMGQPIYLLSCPTM